MQEKQISYTAEEIAGVSFKFIHMAFALRKAMYFAPLSRQITSQENFSVNNPIVFQSMFYQDITNIFLSEILTFFHNKKDLAFLNTLNSTNEQRLSFRKNVRHPSTHVSNAVEEADKIKEFFSDDTYKKILDDIKLTSSYIYELHQKNNPSDAEAFMAQIKMIYEINLA